MLEDSCQIRGRTRKNNLGLWFLDKFRAIIFIKKILFYFLKNKLLSLTLKFLNVTKSICLFNLKFNLN
jgi:hypothetical protein